jgi:hypothetical protein
MGKSKSRGREPRLLTRYDELRRYAQASAAGNLNLLIVLGRPGLGKSRIVRSAVSADACWIEGRTTAFGMYGRLFHDRNKLVVIDDVDDLHHDRDAVRLLKELCQTDPIKTIAWNSAPRHLERHDVPPKFQTTSKTIIIANDWKRLNLDIEALEDRGHVVRFQPSALEVHRHAAEWFDDQEVFDFIGERLSYFEQPSLRHYTVAKELKQADLDWKAETLARGLSGTSLVVAQLKADDAYITEEARAQAFVAAGYGCRATYFNIARKLPETVETPHILLATTRESAPVAISPPLLLLTYEQGVAC